MKGIVVFDTTHGNTRKIAETISQTLKELGVEAEAVRTKDVKRLSAKEYDFLVLGSPTRFGTMSFGTRRFLLKVKSNEWMNKPFAAFDTENPENIEKGQGSAGEKIAEKLAQKKMKQVLPVLKAVVLGWRGPLKEGEIERTEEYTRELAARLKEG
jgi:menaquinone-dependent protoporphyrinogen IX oxidase